MVVVSAPKNLTVPEHREATFVSRQDNPIESFGQQTVTVDTGSPNRTVSTVNRGVVRVGDAQPGRWSRRVGGCQGRQPASCQLTAPPNV